MNNTQNETYYSTVPNNYTNYQLGKLIHNARKAKKITQAALSEMIPINRMYLVRIEQGKRPILDLEQAKKFSEILDIPLDDLIDTIKLADIETPKACLENLFPDIKTKKQKAVIERFISLATRYDLTDEELDHMLTQAIAYTQYCSRLK